MAPREHARSNCESIRIELVVAFPARSNTVVGPNNGMVYFRNFSRNNGISWIPLFSYFSIRAKKTEF